MGLTVSTPPQLDLDEHYKLIRRYTSDIYGDLTVIQSKQNPSQTYALKELITQDASIMRMIENRKKLQHRNLVALVEYCYSGEQSICSNIRKIQMVFEYYGRSLEEETRSRAERGEGFRDLEVLGVLRDSIECLGYLEEMGVLHMVGSMKTILYDPATKQVKYLQNPQLQLQPHRPPTSSTVTTTTSAPKAQLNMLSLMCLKKSLPLHPLNEPRDVCDVCLPAEKVAHQNLFVLGIVCLGLCWGRDPLELGIYGGGGNGKGGYNFGKIQKRIGQIKGKFPSVHRVLAYYMNETKPSQKKINYASVLAQIHAVRRSFTKQNQRSQKAIDIQPVEKVGEKKFKKLPYLRQMRLSNNDIPNQF